MTQEDKKLLLKGLCARLPYETHVYIEFENGNILDDTVLNAQYIHDWMAVPSCQNMAIKPYLRSMSSMTEEEKKQFFKLKQMSVTVIVPNVNRLEIEYIVDLEDDGDGLNHLYDWLNAHHFDYRGLIEKGLALEAPDGMYNVSQKWTPLRSGLKENEDGQIVGGVKL